MHPNILEGDVVLANRLAHQLNLPLTDVVVTRLGEPQRGSAADFGPVRIPADACEMSDLSTPYVRCPT